MPNRHVNWIKAHRNTIIIAVSLGAIVSYLIPVDTLMNAVADKPAGPPGHSGQAPGHTGNPPPGHGGPIPGHSGPGYDPTASSSKIK